MSESPVVLKIDKPHFMVELHETMLKIDLKEDAENEIKEGVETKSPLGQILGKILNMFAPLHVRLNDRFCESRPLWKRHDNSSPPQRHRSPT
jgi:hypothetical protein